MSVGKRLRFEVFKRDNFTCSYCGRTPPTVVLEPDHILAESNGGPTTMDNLVTACFDCNRGKSNVPLTSVSRPLAEVMEQAAEKKEQIDAYNQFLNEKMQAEDNKVSGFSKYWLDKMLPKKKQGRYVFGDDGRNQSIKTFLRRMPESLIREAMDIAASRIDAEFGNDMKRWKYFCGVCWRMIRRAEGEE